MTIIYSNKIVGAANS